MNFLAHLLLSGNSENVIMGNYVADFVKGRLTEEKTRLFHPDFVQGLKLHRFIDSYTDTHPVVKEVRHRIALTHGKSASVAVDLFFDHFLAKDFSFYSGESLPGFCERMYQVIRRNGELVPDAMRPMADAMVKGHWLEGYALPDGIGKSINGLARRYSFMSSLAGAEKDLMVNFDFYQTRFQLFFPELTKATEDFLKSND
jgi:acyl carrier protein phosphodiesterase